MIKQSKNNKSSYTKLELTKALFTLLEQDYIADITILQICQQANISRAAFYRNFDTKEDIINYAITIKIKNFLKQTNMSDEKVLFDYDSFIHLWAQDINFFRLLLKNDLIVLFARQFKEFLTAHIHNLASFDDIYIDYMASTIAYGTVAMLDVWLEHDCKETTEELLVLFDKLQTSMQDKRIY